MSLVVNMLIGWVDETSECQGEDSPESQGADGSEPRVDRVLWIDPSGTNVVTIDIFDKRALPEMQKHQELADAIAGGTAEIQQVDPYAGLFRPESDMPLKVRKYRDRAWEAIAPLVENPEVFIPSKRGLLVREASERTGHTRATIYRWLRKYWQRGQCRDSVQPDFDRCGAPGVDRPADDAISSRKRGRQSLLTLEMGRQTGINVTAVIRQRVLRGIGEFYRPRKVSMRRARQKTLKAYFSIGSREEGNVAVPVLPPDDELPSLHQFWYYYRKYRDPVRALTLQYGASRYESDFRPVLHHSRDMAFGPGSLYQVDFTYPEIELVSSADRSKRIGRPLFGLCLDVFSGVIAGLSVSAEYESGLALMLLLENAFLDKVPLSRVYGIPFTDFEWPCKYVSEGILLDRGPGEGPIADNWVDALNTSVHNTAPRRGDQKGSVEWHFRGAREEMYIDLPGAYPRDRRPDGPDPRDEACLTVYDFARLMILRILEYNSLSLIRDYPMDPDMIADGILPRPLELWHWGIKNRSGHLRVMPPDVIRVNLLPEGTAFVDRRGLHFRKLDYVWPLGEEILVDAGVRGRKKFRVAYDPRIVNAVYLRLDNGRRLERCELLPRHSAFLGWTWDEVEEYYRLRKVAEQADGTRQNDVHARTYAYKEHIVANAQEKATEAKKGKSRASLRGGVKENRVQERTLERKRGAGSLEQDSGDARLSGGGTGLECDDGDESVEERVPWPQDVSGLRELRERKLERE